MPLLLTINQLTKKTLMKTYLLPLISLLSLFACSNESSSEKSIETDPQPLAFPTVNFQEIFDSNSVNGAFLLYDLKKDTTLVFNQPRTKIGFLPASTFKIINSMIALESGVIADEEEIIKWDGEKRFVSDWNRDHNLRSAIKYSVVWFYQEIARRVGEEKMQHFIDTVGYGNQNIDGGIDLFWLQGDIRITMEEQVDFLKRLYKNELPFSQRTLDIVKDIMILEKTDNYILRGKTGWAARVEPNIGWFVGYLETNGNVYFFVNNIDILDEDDNAGRKKITLEVLEQLGLLKESQ